MAASLAALAVAAMLAPAAVQAQSTLTFQSLKLPPGAPRYFSGMYHSALTAPLPFPVGKLSGIPALIPQNESDADPLGTLGTFQPGGPTTTATNAFFMSLGTNGRSCATCHQPATAMSVTPASVTTRFLLTLGTDPVFAPVDGANCPNKVASSGTSRSLLGSLFGDLRGLFGFQSSHSLLLGKGLFRIFLPVPDNAEYTIKTISDPNGCNTDPGYNSSTDSTGKTVQIISVYRRPLSATNLTLATTAAFGVSPSGNIMWDGREATLSSQATDATLGHAQALSPPTAAQVAQMVAFESGIYSAQSADKKAGPLTASGATGGPQTLATSTPGSVNFLLTPPTTAAITPYSAWQPLTSPAQASIYRGQQIFNTTPFTTTGVAGFNDAGFAPGAGPPTPNTTCSTCHNQVSSGADILPAAQRDIGIGGDSPNLGGPLPATDLPIFQLTCPVGTTAYNGSIVGSTVVITTNDPGAALITGKCADIGKFTGPPLRALAGRAPYFSNGSAPALADVVNFYNTRFSIGLTAMQKQDLANFLGTL